MANPSGDLGTWAETQVVKLMNDTYWPHAERRRLRGAKDRGDTTGHPGFVCEVKAQVKKTAKQHCAAWLRETETERVNAGADFGFVAWKPIGWGATRVHMWPTIMYHRRWNELLFQGPWDHEYQGIMYPPRVATNIIKVAEPDWWHWYNRTEEERKSLGFPFSYLAVIPNQSKLSTNDTTFPPQDPQDPAANWWCLTPLGQMLDLLNRAGYGTRKGEHATHPTRHQPGT